MENNTEDFDGDPDENIEEELEKMDEKVSKPSKAKKPTDTKESQTEDKEAPIKDTFSAYHQEEVTAIVNNLTGDVIAKGFKNEGIAMAFAELLNRQEKISLATGAQ